MQDMWVVCHRDLLAFVFVPAIQHELELFHETIVNSRTAGSKTLEIFNFEIFRADLFSRKTSLRVILV